MSTHTDELRKLAEGWDAAALNLDPGREENETTEEEVCTAMADVYGECAEAVYHLLGEYGEPGRMHSTELHPEVVPASQETALRDFTETLPPGQLRTALYDVLDALSVNNTATVRTPDVWAAA